MKSLHYLLVFMMFATACGGQAKTPSREDAKIKKTQGTNQYANIYCALTDKSGNPWFGTMGEGVYRYDGKVFTQFTEKDGLSSNKIQCILEDKSGNIWFGTDKGLCRYDGKSITRVPISIANKNSYIFHGAVSKNAAEENEVWSMMQDKTGKFWIGTKAGVYCYDGRFFTRFLDNDSIINKAGLHLKMVHHIYEDKAGNIWFGSGMPPGMEGLCRYDSRLLIQFNPGGAKWIRSVIEDKTGKLWIGTRSQGVWTYDGKAFSGFKQANEKGNPMLEDKAGNIWFSGGENDNGYSGDKGIWRYDGKTFKNFTTKDGMGDYSVWCMVEDRAGNIWVGTRNVGLYKYDGKRFANFSE